MLEKGEIIATIANPQFIQLQEEYLSSKQDNVCRARAIKTKEE
jgi:hypothetical protein